ncbi:hypothetical protein KL953_08610 [Mycolicibacterium goodii]|uniref:hypothetical protein n=1 Tax=Mycolicibacterium goodii TaxID=134601 RepID=UPI001BDC63DD|nr:hypothetical protein [Mycolicibacterium goodii]MBU8808956.1 hypothetical protein [Mycolicibacterium goodii]
MPRRTPTPDDVVKLPASHGSPYILGWTRSGLIRLSRFIGGDEHRIILAAPDAYRVADALVDAAEQAPDRPARP